VNGVHSTRVMRILNLQYQHHQQVQAQQHMIIKQQQSPHPHHRHQLTMDLGWYVIMCWHRFMYHNSTIVIAHDGKI
jgi:hypothetical protein